MGTIYLDGICYSSGGGGGASSADQVSLDDANLAYVADDVQEAFEKVTKSLTYAEYEALTEEEKNNGTLYFITDVNGDGQNFQPVIYSTEEREIGVYIDGKPLYCKVLVNSSTVTANNNSWTTIPLNNQPTNIDKFVFGALLADAYPVSYEQPRIIYDSENTIFKMASVQNSSYAAGKLLIYAEYTKTTDVAGSGTWTPQGIPAAHYSTDEHIVGTWVDGSTVYERDFYYTQASMPGSSSPITIASDLSADMKDVIKIDITGRLHYNSEDQDVWCTDGIVGRANLKNHTLQVWQTWTSAVSAYSNFAVSVVLRYTKSST